MRNGRRNGNSVNSAIDKSGFQVFGQPQAFWSQSWQISFSNVLSETAIFNSECTKTLLSAGLDRPDPLGELTWLPP